VHRAGEDAADRALAALIIQIDHVRQELGNAGIRAVELQELRRHGQSWHEIVAGEERPLIVEQISDAIASLATTGGLWRRDQATALHSEGVSINRIAALYGVTRQRISTLLHDRPEHGDPPLG
jgi:hypothetical protein